MNSIQDKLLVMAGTESKTIIQNSLEPVSGLEILEADSENKAFELIYNHFFVVVIIDETLPHLDIYKIGAMLLSHKNTYNAPLLIITDTIAPGKFLTDFRELQIDYIVKPFDEQLIRAKINIFFELFKQKTAVEQSIDELDQVYKKIVDQHEIAMKEEFSKKEAANRSTSAAQQMQQPLRNLQGNINQLLQSRSITPEIKSNLASIKMALERISQIRKTLLVLPENSKRISAQTDAYPDMDKTYTILYVVNSEEDFSIFSHIMKSAVKCELVQAKTLEQGREFIVDKEFDLIFIDDHLPDGTGFDLLSRLKRMRSEIPVIFTLDKSSIHKGSEAISKGAFAYFGKEEISAGNLVSIINSTLQKAKITREAEDAQNRVVMIARKDTLTKLYNRQCFDTELQSETSRAKRYNLPLSILIVNFDNFKTINKTHGFDAGDTALRKSATLIQGMVRSNDVVCRYGSEGFGLVLTNTAQNSAKILAERIREKIYHHEFKKDSSILKLTVSIGIAAYVHKTDTTCPVLVKNAMDALAAAIGQGGNTVKIWGNHHDPV